MWDLGLGSRVSRTGLGRSAIWLWGGQTRGMGGKSRGSELDFDGLGLLLRLHCIYKYRMFLCSMGRVFLIPLRGISAWICFSSFTFLVGSDVVCMRCIDEMRSASWISQVKARYGV